MYDRKLRRRRDSVLFVNVELNASLSFYAAVIHPIDLLFRTDAEVINYIKTVFFPGVTDAQLSQLAMLYPSDITQGSPFDTGILNALTPQFKRIASFQGDGVFQAPRRWLLQNVIPTNPNVWAFSMYFIRFI